MALAIANSARSVGANTNVLTISSATAGRLLIVFMNQTASVSAPTISDNTLTIDGEDGSVTIINEVT